MHETILTYNATETLTLVFDGVVGVTHKYDASTDKNIRYQSLVGYADFKLSQRDSLNFRYENFNDLTSNSAVNNLFTTTANPNARPPQIDSYTLTNRYTLANGSEIRAEYRFDSATKELFPAHNGEFKKTQSTVTIGWLYSI